MDLSVTFAHSLLYIHLLTRSLLHTFFLSLFLSLSFFLAFFRSHFMPSSQVSRLPRLNQHCPLHSYTFCSAQQAIRCCLWWLQVSFHERPLEIERRYIMVDEELERRRGFSFWSILYIYCSIEPFDLFCVLYIYYIFFSLIPLLHRFFPPMEVSYQETSNSLMGALLIHDIVNAKSKATPTSENPIKCVIVQR